jgi:hypothetical protein
LKFDPSSGILGCTYRPIRITRRFDTHVSPESGILQYLGWIARIACDIEPNFLQISHKFWFARNKSFLAAATFERWTSAPTFLQQRPLSPPLIWKRSGRTRGNKKRKGNSSTDSTPSDPSKDTSSTRYNLSDGSNSQIKNDYVHLDHDDADMSDSSEISNEDDDSTGDDETGGDEEITSTMKTTTMDIMALMITHWKKVLKIYQQCFRTA